MTERTGYLTATEVEAAQALHQRAPYAVTGISSSIFSLARHGGMTYEGCRYTYIPEHDECVRDDVLAMVRRMRRKAKPVQPKEPPQVGLFEGVA